MRLRKQVEEPEIPTASMADIAFLLIVFFMLTSVFAETRGINFSIPQSDEEEEESTEREEAVQIKIEPNGQVLLDENPISPTNMKREIKEYLWPKLERWPEKPILVTADADSPYGVFVEVYDALNRIEGEFRQDPGLQVKDLKVQILSLAEIERLKSIFGEDIFG